MKITIQIGMLDDMESRFRRKIWKSMYYFASERMIKRADLVMLSLNLIREYKFKMTLMRFTLMMYLASTDLHLPLPYYWYINGPEIDWQSFEKVLNQFGYSFVLCLDGKRIYSEGLDELIHYHIPEIYQSELESDANGS